jgi:NDP-sugar pyrophosphorylase family protein
MRDLTNEVPKPMLKVHGKPILEHIVMGVLSAGIRDIFIVTGFRADVIEDYFGNGRKWGANLTYGRQLIQDGTGKAPELARVFTSESPFLLTYGDILVKPETYAQMLARYKTGPFSGVITVTAGQDVTQGVRPPPTRRLDQTQSTGLVQCRHLHLQTVAVRLHGEP